MLKLSCGLELMAIGGAEPCENSTPAIDGKTDLSLHIFVSYFASPRNAGEGFGLIKEYQVIYIEN